MKESKTTIFGILLLPALSLVNLSHLLWTFWLTVEQIKTGWGYGTNISTLGLVPMVIQRLSIPVLLAALLFFVLACFNRRRKSILIVNLCLFVAALLQFGISGFLPVIEKYHPRKNPLGGLLIQPDPPISGRSLPISDPPADADPLSDPHQGVFPSS